MKYAWIAKNKAAWPVTVTCEVLGVSTSGYFEHQRRRRTSQPSQPGGGRLSNEAVLAHIRAIHAEVKGEYGWPRVWKELLARGIRVGKDRVQRLMHTHGIKARNKRKFVVTTDSKHDLPIAENLLARDFTPAAPDRVWSSDITYIATDEGWLYLAGIKDLFNGELVGYALDARMTQQLVMQALFRAVATKRPGKGLIHHSDRGSQYCAHAYQKLLRQFGMQASMSRKGNCWDNAPMESCWGSLKTELVHHCRFATREQAKREITEYIEIFYNRIRKQARLGHLSPAAFSQQYHAMQMAA